MGFVQRAEEVRGMTRRVRWIAWAAIVISFLCGITDFGRNINWNAALVVMVLAAFVAAIVIHARKLTEGS